jgi:hypothetical protein
MTVKLLMTWDIKPGKEAEYFDFVVREFVPGLQHVGIQPTEAYLTVYGTGSQILTGGVADDLPTMQNILEGEDWHVLQDKLLTFVDNFKKKVVPATGRFQLL